MSQTSTTTNTGGIGLVGLLTVLFVGLKLAGIGVVATWSWWWVLSPLWIGFGLWLVVALIFVIIIAIVSSK